jgi:hypothetical protein
MCTNTPGAISVTGNAGCCARAGAIATIVASTANSERRQIVLLPDFITRGSDLRRSTHREFVSGIILLHAPIGKHSILTGGMARAEDSTDDT